MSGSPAPPAPTIRPRQLPNSIKDFTGRTNALRELDRLTASNVVVITGMPGIGKTTLALHWSQQNADRFPDGQLFLAVNAYSSSTPFDPNAALARLLDALGVPAAAVPATPDQRRDLLNRLLTGRRMLIVLDDVGHSEQARPLLPTAPECLTLITSRHTLGQLAIRDAVPTFTMQPLTTADSAALLAQLIGGPRIDREPEALTRLAKAAAGHPLALRIIGDHVLERPLASIADLTDDLRHHLLDPVGDDDQVSLNTVFSWSYRALDPETARLFRRLAQHPGPSIGVEVAAAMARTTPDDAQARLNALAKAHLIDHHTARHHRFHDLLRIYAGKCAIAEDGAATIAATRVRALEWYLHSAANAAAMLFPEEPPVLDLPPLGDGPAIRFARESDAQRWYERERDNLTAATRSAARHGLDRLTWQIQGTLHQIIHRSGKLDGLLELNEIAVAAARRDNHPAAEIGHLLNIGAVHLAQRRYRRAEAVATAALQLVREMNQPDYEAISTYAVATIFLKTGRTDDAVRLYERVLEMCRSTSNGLGEAFTQHRLGDVHRQRGDRELAVSSYLRALEMLQRVGSTGGHGRTHNRLAGLYLEMGRLSSAGYHCEQALRAYERTKDEKSRCEALTIRAEIRRPSTPAESIVDARGAVEVAIEIGDELGRASALAVLADALADMEAHADAVTAASQGLQALDRMSGPDVLALRTRLLAGYAASLRRSQG